MLMKNKVKSNSQEKRINEGDSHSVIHTSQKHSNRTNSQESHSYDGKVFFHLFFIKDNHLPFAPFTMIGNDIKRIIKRLKSEINTK